MWLFNLFKRNKNVQIHSQVKSRCQPTHSTSSTEYSTYESKPFPAARTTTKQKVADFDTATGNYPVGTPNYLEMKIVSSTIPPQNNYNVLNDNEQLFFRSFYEQLLENNISPSQIRLTRMSSGEFNVDYVGLCYIGKINLYQPPTSYAVIKHNNKRATKVFNNKLDAEHFILNKEGYKIETRQPTLSSHMQYLRGSTTIKNFSNISVNQCIEYIPYWIRYIKYCKHN